ncbi:MAG: DUF1059 domain-containing protein [Candidatus Acidiferrales bacterium]
MSKMLRCSELIPGCDFIARGESDDEVIQEASRHVRAKHNLQKMSAGVVAIIRGAIYDEEKSVVFGKHGNDARRLPRDGGSDGSGGKSTWPRSTEPRPE